MPPFSSQTQVYQDNLSDNLSIFDLGLVDFKQAYDFQNMVFEQVKSRRLNFVTIFCQHRPVITLGRAGERDDILVTDSELKRRDIGVYKIERGGRVTYHGPGQLLIYPILNLNYFKKDIHLFLRWLEELVIRILDKFGIVAKRYTGLTGVWVGDKKIASIGIAIKNWITFHGLSINIGDEDLRNYSLIRPCGMDITMTSMEEILKRKIMIEEVKTVAVSIIGGQMKPQLSFAIVR